MKNEKRWVLGTKYDRWYQIDENDRDYDRGISESLFKQLVKKDGTLIKVSDTEYAFSIISSVADFYTDQLEEGMREGVR